MGLHNVRMTDPSDHLPNDLRFYLWPYFLKLSPSYAEVHRLYTTNTRAPRRPRIPANLKAVARVYEIVGDVYSETRSASTSLRLISPSPLVFELSEPFASTNPAAPWGLKW